MWMGTYIYGKLSTFVLKFNIFNIGKRYGVKYVKKYVFLFHIAIFWMMNHMKCQIYITCDIFEDCSLLKGFN